MNLENIRRDDWILGGLALLLLIDLFAFPWFSVGIGPFSLNLTATDGPDGWTAILAVIALIAVFGDLAVERLSPQTTLPTVGGSRVMTRLALAGVAAFFIALKFLLHIHFSDFGWGFYLAVVLTVALLYFADQARRAPVAPVAPPPPPVGTPGPPPSGPAAP